jgi:glycerate-2-kinase
MPIIKNHRQLATTELRQRVLEVLETGLAQAMPGELMLPTVQYDKDFHSLLVHTESHDLMQGRFFVVGGGKAAGGMAEALEQVMGAENIEAGLVTAPAGRYQTKKIKVSEAELSLPGRKGEKAVEEMLKFKEKYGINENDAVICLLSGGGSAIMPSLPEGVRLRDLRETTRVLKERGIPINEINIVRKHLSRTKGGQMALHFQPARVISLIISDVVQDDISVIGSAPTTPDPTTYNDALWVLDRYKVADKIPGRIKRYLEAGASGQAPETPKHLDNTFNYIVGTNAVVLEAMAHKSRNLGFKPMIGSTTVSGEAADAARRKAQEIIVGNYADNNAIFFGGETTVALPEDYGSGGRNQHLAAASLRYLSDLPGEWVMASVNTDGMDGGGEAAGAIIDNHSFRKAESMGLDIESYLGTFNTYNFFKKLGNSLIITGGTGTNVGDIIVYFRKV